MTRYQSAYSNAELAEQRYIKECGECGVETIVDVWIDDAPKLKPAVETALRDSLRLTLVTTLTELETAEWAAVLCGNPDLKTWSEDQEMP